MEMRGYAVAAAVCLGLAAVGAAAGLRVAVSTGGMEGMKEIAVQAHVAGDDEWKELVGLEEGKVKERVEASLGEVSGLKVVAEGTETPRLLVVVVGHVIADPSGEKDTAATHVQVSLNQRVEVRREGSERPVAVNGTTWQRSLLITGLKETMGERVGEKLGYLVGQFAEAYGRENAGGA